jgi:NDP-sugar pyrophosphorylase family protein
MARIKHAIIMAAGRGSRMMPLTADIPKAMAPYNGSTLVCQGISQVRKHIEYLHITVGYRGAMLAEHVIKNGVSSVFNTEGHANAWWVYNTILKLLDEPIFVLTCDNVTELDFDLLEDDYFSVHEPACMLVPVLPVVGLEGDYIFHRSNVVTELNRTKKSDIYCSGIQVINPARINQITEEAANFYALWAQLIGKEQVIASRIYPKRWFAVDTMEQLGQLNQSNVSPGRIATESRSTAELEYTTPGSVSRGI